MAPLLERVSPEEALERVKGALGDRVSDAGLNFGQVEVTCEPGNLVEVVTTLRDAEGIRCRFFAFLSAIDRTEFTPEGREPGGLEVLVHLYSPDHAFHVNVHVPVGPPGDDVVCPTISGVFGGALWHERETHEMFGIDFEGHPRLVPLYLPEDFEGRPLLKSFRLPSRAVVKEWPGAKDPDEAAAAGR